MPRDDVRVKDLYAIDWNSLEHAYGPANDAPAELAALLSEDGDIFGNAIAYLDSAVLHQGTIYSATAPAVEFVAGVLDDPRLLVASESALPWDDRLRPRLAALLEWIGLVADSAAWGDPPNTPDPDTAQCQALRGELYARVSPYADHADASIREAAIGALARLVRAPELAGHRAPLAERLLAFASHPDPSTRAGAALTIGGLGVAPQAFLGDGHPGVRACAALTPGFDGDADALAEVRAALRDPAVADSWFEENPPQLEGHLRFALVAALLRRTSTFGEVTDEALAIARMTNAHTVKSDWGPFLKRAFPDATPKHTPLPPAERRFLAAIVANDECWGVIANPRFWLEAAGLPHDRDRLRSLTEA